MKVLGKSSGNRLILAI